MGRSAGSRAGCEVFEGQEDPPEASFGCLVVQRRGEGGEGEACCALRPGEPYAGFGLGEGVSDEWVVEGVDLAGCAGAYCYEGVGLGGLYLMREQAG